MSEVARTPNAETTSSLVTLRSRIGKDLPATGGLAPEIRDFRLDYKTGALIVDTDILSETIQKSFEKTSGGSAIVPFALPNSMLLQFSPRVGKEALDIVKNNKLDVTNVFPNLSAIQISADLTRFFKAQPTDNNNNDTILRGLIAASEYYKSLDPNIIAATPDTLLSGQVDAEKVTASDVMSYPPGTQQLIDWGMSDIQADQLWEMPGASDGTIVGVMDAGFARHEDLVFLRPAERLVVSDHGNHVAGILCARHDNNKGMVGVLPNCFIRPQAADALNIAADTGNVSQFIISFGQVLHAFDRLLEEESNIKAFNVSLGYNWVPNFGIDPDGASSGVWRDYVRMQGPFALSALSRAQRTGQVIFSAAGNDSSQGREISAEFASPMNWAAVQANSQHLPGEGYGIIVEAHDKNGNRAEFSNSNGSISCPGVDIRSSVAMDENQKPSDRSYGLMSGTSMASPYCAGGFALLSLVLPTRNPKQILKCMLDSTERSSAGTPMLKLKDAYNRCH
ncbi:hypothetical protein ASG58_14130 [Rhizobium sp. Leaf383]|nr:hypothetical protein ASG58_14130 [Rhizobium sp. Leaf383]